eukprot:SAG11_NODE_10284_length_842_cov_0.830417_1_plen_37_part_00
MKVLQEMGSLGFDVRMIDSMVWNQFKGMGMYHMLAQ